MDIRQLLEYLKTASPEMYSTLTDPMLHPGEFSDGEIPIQEDSDMFGYKQHLQNTVGRGYDPNLIVEDGKDLAKIYSDNSEQDAILSALQMADPTMPQREEFPSDFSDLPFEGWQYPAYDSAQVFNNLSDEDLLKLLLKNKA